MAWNTGIAYTTGTVIDSTLLTGVYTDLTLFGGNVDGGGNILANVNVTAIGARCPGITYTLDTATPSVAANTCVEYYKNGVKVIAYNDSGTIRYRWQVGAGAVAAWTHSLTAP